MEPKLVERRTLLKGGAAAVGVFGSGASASERALADTPPSLPDHVVERVRAKYVEAYERLTGRDFTAYLRSA